MSDYINDIQESLLAGDVTVISIIVAVVAVFITICKYSQKECMQVIANWAIISTFISALLWPLV